MHRWKVVAAALLISGTARAAEVTDVADAADVIRIGEDRISDPFDLYVGTNVELLWSGGKILREPIDRPGVAADASSCSEQNPRACTPVDELEWSRSVQRMMLQLEVGLFHDLSLTFGLPIYLGDAIRFRYADGVDASNSSIDPQNGDPDDTLFAHNTSTKHQGLGALELGLRFAPLSDERDDTKPSWVVYFNWAMPYTAPVYDPSNAQGRATESNPGSMGDGVHRLTFGTANSRRIGNFGLIGIDPKENRRGYTDPYVDFSYTLPIPEKGRSPRPLVKDTDNEFGNAPSHIARMNAGFEVIPYEDLRNFRKLAIDIGFRGGFISEGRNLSEVSDALGEFTYTEQYFTAAGLLGLYVQAAQYIRLRLAFTLGVGTEHFLTYENVGEDGSGDGQVLPDEPLDSLNPYFCGNGEEQSDLCRQKSQASYDQVGFRLKSSSQVFYGLTAGLLFTF